MSPHRKLNPFKNFKFDIPASIVVFLVAMPLSLGIAMASGAPLFSGLISGVIGGVIVGSLSGSALGVSGPAAGLAIIVLTAIADLGGFEILLVSIILAGIIQVVMGYLKAGIIGYYFPTSVIEGMLAGIGIMIFLKQIPHAFGYDGDPMGDYEFFQVDGQNTFSALVSMMSNINQGAIVVTIISLVILIFWDTKFMKKQSFTKIIPGPLVAVAAGILLNNLFSGHSDYGIGESHLVSIPIAGSIGEFVGNFTFPDFSALSNPKVYTTAIVIAAVASIETLLSLEAADKQDPLKRVSPTNRELKAQGIGNIIAGFVGGLPVTQVIVRSSVNMQTGGKTKASTVLHGFWILLSVLLIPFLLNQIPLATLASILLLVGYKLAKPALFIKMYNHGKEQFLPFIVTIVAMLFSDLLKGIGLGMVVAIFIILRNNFKVPYKLISEELVGKNKLKILLSEDVTFLNKASILKTLNEIPDDFHVEIDGSNTQFIHHDVFEIIEDFKISCQTRNIELSLTNVYTGKQKEPIQHFEISKK